MGAVIVGMLAAACGGLGGPGASSAEPTRIDATAFLATTADVAKVTLDAFPAGSSVPSMTQQPLPTSYEASCELTYWGAIACQEYVPAGDWDVYATALDGHGGVIGRGKTSVHVDATGVDTRKAVPVKILVYDWALWANQPTSPPAPDPGPVITRLVGPSSVSLATLASGSFPTFTVAAVDPDGGTAATASAALSYEWVAFPVGPGKGLCDTVTFAQPTNATTTLSDTVTEQCSVTAIVREPNGNTVTASIVVTVTP
jgi:hypothetical protein